MYDSRIEYSPRRTAWYVPCRKRPHDLRLDVAGFVPGGRTAREELSRRSVPAQPEVLRDVCNSRPLDAHGGVVPADPAPRHVRRRIPGIAAVERQVDPADERNSIVDHDRLLVVAVREARCSRPHGPRSSCAATSASSISRTSLCDGLNIGIGAPFHERSRTSTRSASSASRFRTIIGSSSRDRCSSGEKNQPARWMNDSARASSARDRRQRLGAVDENVEAIAVAAGKLPCA